MTNETLTYDQTSPAIASRCAISKREEQANGKKKQVWQNNADFTAFTLSAFLPGFEIPYALETTELGDDKEKVSRVKYADEKVQFVYESVLARVEAAAKAKHASGGDPAETVDELLSATRGGQYMADQKSVREAVSAYLLSKGNSEAQAAAIVSKLDTRVLKSADEATRKTITLVVNKVAEAVDLSAYQTVVDNILKAAEGETVDLSTIEL